MKKTAVILLNLGAPNNQDVVQPFLTNLFSDPAIIGLPNPFRWLLARFIAKRRTPHAKEIYKKMGGGSPLLRNTLAQAEALEKELGEGFKCFISMRYWHPFSYETLKRIEEWQADQIILLPLYPQFSTTTTASSIKDLALQNTKTVYCYPTDQNFIQAQVDLIKPVLEEAKKHGQPRVLFSAHGLPEKIIQKGDPYQWQCEQTAKAIAAQLGDVEWLNCYQSRVGPLKWISPATDDEIVRAGKDKRPIVLVPIAFVSEHSETLVELDIEYKELAEKHHVPFYGRVPTVSTHPLFIQGLAGLVRKALANERPCAIQCPAEFSACPCRRANYG